MEEINKLRDLDFSKQLIFVYLTCERLYPNYVYFSHNYNFGNPVLLRKAIDYLYDNIFQYNPDKGQIKLLLKSIDENTPDTEDYTTIFVSSALDACTTIQYGLEFLMVKAFSKILFISTAAIDTVEMYIQELENLDFNVDKNVRQKIEAHPLMEKERRIQSGIITFLANTQTIDPEDIHTLMRLQENNKKGNLSF